MRNRTWWTLVALVAVFALACTPATTPTTAPGTQQPATDAPATDAPATDAPATDAPATDAPATDAPATDAPATDEPPTDAPPTDAPGEAIPSVPTGYTELDAALNGDYTGRRVTIQTQWIGGEGANFAAAFADFEAATGIDVVADGVGSSHETTLRYRIEGGDTTLDLAMLAQPSAVVAYGSDGRLVDVSTFMDTAKLNEDFPATVSLLTGDGGEIWGVPYKVDVKSTVWYPIKAFAAAGYEVPTTFDELVDLADSIVAAGSNPWCIGMGAGTATGWQATDWVEDIMLRTTTPENYDAWIRGDLDFTSPEVKRAFELAGQMWFTPGYVQNVLDITATQQTEPMDPMFPPDGNWEGFTPGCWMQKQATWYGPDFFPDVRAGGPGTVSQHVIGEDIGIFYFPMIDAEFGTPALGAGDTVMVISPPDGSAVRDEVKAFAQFLATPQGTQRWIEAGSAISANQNTPAAWYEGSYKLAIGAEIVGQATSFGFDASDLMPPEVGAGTFWTESVRWIESNGADLDGTLQRIEDSWPE